MTKRYRLAVVAKHPVYCQLPLFKKLARHPQIDLMVYFGSNFGLREGLVRVVQHGVMVKLYTAPDLSDLPHKFMRNYGITSAPRGMWSPINPGIWKEFQNEHHDAVMIHGYSSLMDNMSYLAARVTNTPIMIMGETVLKQHQSWWKSVVKNSFLRKRLKKVEVCLAIGSKSREFYCHYGVPDNRIVLVPYSVDNDHILEQAKRLRAEKEELKAKYGVASGSPVILFVGRLIGRKRPFDLVEAFRRINYPAQLVITGDGPLFTDVERMVKEQRLENIILVGLRMPQEVQELFAASDIFVLPSSYEPWAFVVNEAMCFGLPVVAADGVAAALDLVHHGENGYIYQAGDVGELARILTGLVVDFEKRQAMGQRSRELISTWNYDVCVDNIVQALEYVASRGKPC